MNHPQEQPLLSSAPIGASCEPPSETEMPTAPVYRAPKLSAPDAVSHAQAQYPGDALALATKHFAHSISPAEALALADKHVAARPPTSPIPAQTPAMLPDPSPAIDALAISVSDHRSDIESLQEHNVQLASMVAILTEQVAAVAAIVPTLSPPAPGSVSSGAMSPRELRSGNSRAFLFSCTTTIAEMPMGGILSFFFPSTFSCTTPHAEMPLFSCTNHHAEVPLASSTFCPTCFFSTNHHAETFLAFDHTISFFLLAPPPAAPPLLSAPPHWPRHQLAHSAPLPDHGTAALAPPAHGAISAPRSAICSKQSIPETRDAVQPVWDY